jgi:hypothetical protein
MISTKELKKQQYDKATLLRNRNSTHKFINNPCGSCNSCFQMTRIHSQDSSPTWSGDDDGNQGPNLQKSCAINFFQRNLGNSYIQSNFSGGQTSEQITTQNSVPKIQRKCSSGGGCGKEDEDKRIQAKLKIGPANDVYELEADWVAEQVIRMPEPKALTGNDHPPLGMQIQRISNGESTGFAADINLNQSSGRPLSTTTLNYMEPRFGVNFSHVRLHTDQQAQRTTSQVQARAFTYESNIWLGKGESEQERKLLAHELTHVVQQGFAQEPIQKQVNDDSPAFFNSDSCLDNTGHRTRNSCISMRNLIIQRNGTCDVSNCPADHGTSVPVDLRRAIGYVNDALTSINQSSLSEDTVTALDWFFRDHSTATIDTIRDRLTCLVWALNDTLSNNRYACHPEYSAVAYVSMGSEPICGHYLTNVCLTNNYFSKSDRGRAETMIHECGHREGLSVGDYDDIYDHVARFMHVSTAEALGNSDSYAFFASSVVEGIPLSVLMNIRPGAGVVFTAGGTPTWLARLDVDVEFQHPVLNIFNPILGTHISLMGIPERAIGEDPTMSGSQLSTSILWSLIGGVRIGPARTGAAGTPYVSLFGGPGLSVVPGEIQIGAEAGATLGYRWRWLDVSVGARYLYSPTLPEGMEHMVQIGGTIGFTPGIF